jgi:hypothetical protein
MMSHTTMTMQCFIMVALGLLAGCTATPSPVPVRLAGPAEGVSRPYGVAIGAGRVYWTERGNGGAIRWIATSGGPAHTLVRGTSPFAWFCAVDGAWLYWTEYDAGTLRRVPTAGGVPQTLARGLKNPGQLAVYRGAVAWVEYGGNVVKERGPTGRVRVIARDLAGPQAIAIDDDMVYWTEFSDPPALRRRGRAGGAVVTLATVKPECWLVLAGPWLWWTETQGAVRRMPRSGGRVESLAPIPTSGAFAAATATHFYWAEERGHVMQRLPLAGGSVDTVLTGLGHPTVMAADQAAVYWADPEANAIFKFAEHP